MAVLMMGDDEGNVTFHDFLGISSEDSAAVTAKDSAGFGETRATEASASASVGAPSGSHGPVSNCSDLASERQTGDHIEGVRLHSSKSDVSVAEISNRFSGRKRGNADLRCMGSARDKMHLMGMASAERSHLVKVFQNETGGEQVRRNYDNGLCVSMQPPKQTSTTAMLQQRIESRPELVVSGPECSLPMNVGRVVPYSSRFGQSASYMGKTSLKKYSDTTLAGTSTCISQPAADEGSRTGMKDSRILHAISVSSAVPDRTATGLLPSGSRPNVGHLNSGTKSANPPRHHFLTSASRQMTIFYAGQAHVFDDIHPNKAHEIMVLAGSSGGSWSTTYSPMTSVQQPSSEARVPCRENEVGINNMAFSQDTRSRLPSFQSSYQVVSQGEHQSVPGDHLNL